MRGRSCSGVTSSAGSRVPPNKGNPFPFFPFPPCRPEPVTGQPVGSGGFTVDALPFLPVVPGLTEESPDQSSPRVPSVCQPGTSCTNRLVTTLRLGRPPPTLQYTCSLGSKGPLQEATRTLVPVGVLCCACCVRASKRRVVVVVPRRVVPRRVNRRCFFSSLLFSRSRV